MNNDLTSRLAEALRSILDWNDTHDISYAEARTVLADYDATRVKRHALQLAVGDKVTRADGVKGIVRHVDRALECSHGVAVTFRINNHVVTHWYTNHGISHIAHVFGDRVNIVQVNDLTVIDED